MALKNGFLYQKNSSIVCLYLYSACGKYDFYRDGIEETALEHELYLAVSTVTYYRFTQRPLYLRRLAKHNIKLLIIDLNTEKIKQWIK